MLGTIVEARNLESGQHIIRVRKYTQILVKYLQLYHPELNITDDMIKMLSEVSVLHDIGKIAIPDSILLKPGRLTPEEFEEMKTHTIKGCDLLEQLIDVWGEEYRDTAYNVIRHHHEKWDGNGYPDKLKGDEIPLSAQIVSVADVFDALTTKRVYKEPYSIEKAYDMIINDECGVFSNLMKEALSNCILEMAEAHLMTQEFDS